MKTYIVGSINTDFVIECERLPKLGETVQGGNFLINAGGKGANQAHACAKLGGVVKMCGRIGDDLYGERWRDSLKDSGVDVSHVKTAEGCMTGCAVITVFEGNNSIIIDSGANSKITKEDIDSFLNDASKGDILLCQLENPIDIVGYALKCAHERGMTTVLNPAPANTEIAEYLKYVDIITPNEHEVELMGGVEHLLSLGLKTVITTLGENGYEIASRGFSKRYPCLKVTPVDTTAAGDTFCGGLCAKLSLGYDIEESCRFASAAASISTTRYGASTSIPTKDEVIKYLK